MKEKHFHTCLLSKNLGHGSFRGSSGREEGFHYRFQRISSTIRIFEYFGKFLNKKVTVFLEVYVSKCENENFLREIWRIFLRFFFKEKCKEIFSIFLIFYLISNLIYILTYGIFCTLTRKSGNMFGKNGNQTRKNGIWHEIPRIVL